MGDEDLRSIRLHLKKIIPDQRAYFVGQALAGLCAGVPDRDPADIVRRAIEIGDLMTQTLANERA